MVGLKIHTPTGEVFSMDDVTPGDTIANVKAKIQQMKGIPINQQQLLVYDQLLADTYQLPPNTSELELETYIAIEVRKMDGKSLILRGVEAHEYIWEIKCRLRWKLDIPPDQQHLVLDETVLANEMRLSQCNIQHNSILHLIRQPADWRFM